MTLQREMTHFAAQVKGKLTRVFDHDHFEALARQTGFVQRSTSKLTGTAFIELMTTDMLADAAVSLDGLCDLLRQRHPQATMTPQALHQRMLTPQASTYVYAVLQTGATRESRGCGCTAPGDPPGAVRSGLARRQHAVSLACQTR